jgi:hypothetical protein
MLLLDTLPMLGNVLLLCFFVFFIFGIVGVQLWKGVLRNRCFLDFNSTEINSLYEYVEILFTKFLYYFSIFFFFFFSVLIYYDIINQSFPIVIFVQKVVACQLVLIYHHTLIIHVFVMVQLIYIKQIHRLMKLVSIGIFTILNVKQVIVIHLEELFHLIILDMHGLQFFK